MQKERLSPAEVDARSYVVEIVRHYTLFKPITADDIIKQLERDKQKIISKRSLRNIAQWCRLQRPPIPILSTSGAPGGYYFARNMSEAMVWLCDAKSRALNIFKQHHNVKRYMKRKYLGQEDMAL